MSEKEVYKNRDMILGRIDERTKCIPDIQKDISSLKKEVAVIKWKSGIFGTLGGTITMILYYLKNLFLYGPQGH